MRGDHMTQDTMRDKVRSILAHMVRPGSTLGIKSFRESQDGTFALETALSALGH